MARTSKDPKATAPKAAEKSPRSRGEKEAPAGKAGAGKTGPKVPFPRKNQMPTEAEFLARLPASTGKRFDGVRTFLKKQKGVTEDLYFYGPKTGWAYRYLRGTHSLATIMIHDERLVGIVSLDTEAMATVDFDGLSEVGARARKLAHGSPSLMWLDLPLDGTGAADFKTLLKAKLKAQPAAAVPPPPPSPSGRGPTGG